ncbi:hypothetical protein MRX96_005850 [Rhipicephalus microplus]
MVPWQCARLGSYRGKTGTSREPGGNGSPAWCGATVWGAVEAPTQGSGGHERSHETRRARPTVDGASEVVVIACGATGAKAYARASRSVNWPPVVRRNRRFEPLSSRILFLFSAVRPSWDAFPNPYPFFHCAGTTFAVALCSRECNSWRDECAVLGLVSGARLAQ